MPINYYCDVEVQSNVLATDISNSRVGVNLDTPLTTLHVDGIIRAGGGSSSSSRANLSNSTLAFLASSTTYGSVFVASNQFYINTGTSGGTLYIGAPAANTTNLNVQGAATLQTISNATSDTDKFLVSDSGVIKYRTGAEVRSDIGAGTGTVGGSGTTNYIPKWSNSSTLTNSIIYDNGTKVGIGDTGPAVKLQVSTNSPTNNVAALIGDGWVGSDSYHKEGGLLLISGTSQDATQTGAGIAFQTRNTANTNYWKSNMIMDRDGAIRFNLGGSGAVAGSEDLTILSSGKVGIGNTSPQVALDVKDTAQDAIVNITGASGGKPQINIYEGTNNVGRIMCTGNADFDLSNLNSGDIKFGTGGTTSMTIASNGTVNIAGGSLTLDGTGRIQGVDTVSAGTDAANKDYVDQHIPTTTQTIITSNFLDSGSTTSSLRIPFNNLVETTSNQYYNCMDMPAAGTVKRFRMHNTSGSLSTGFTTTMQIYKNGSTTPTSSGALTASSGQIEFDPSNYTFSKGDHLQFAYAKSAGSKFWQGVSASIIIEFDQV